MKPKKIDYTPEETIETPYLRARKEYDDLIGSARIQAANWRRAFFVSMFVLSGLVRVLYQFLLTLF